MFLHIGNNYAVNEKNIIGIFDADTATIQKATKTLINRLAKQNKVAFAIEELPKSFLLVDGKKSKGLAIAKKQVESDANELIFSQLSTSAIVGRLDEKGQ